MKRFFTLLISLLLISLESESEVIEVIEGSHFRHHYYFETEQAALNACISFAAERGYESRYCSYGYDTVKQLHFYGAGWLMKQKGVQHSPWALLYDYYGVSCQDDEVVDYETGECLPACECTEDLIDNQCVAREVGEGGSRTVNGIVEEISDANNQGRICYRIPQEAKSCDGDSNPVISPWQNNPINCTNGVKRQTETDYSASVGALNFARTYFSTERPSDALAKFKEVLDQPLPDNYQPIQLLNIAKHDWQAEGLPYLTIRNGFGTSKVATLSIPSGSRTSFLKTNSSWQAGRVRDGQLTDTANGFAFTSISGTLYEFDSQGRLIKKSFRNGQYQDINYPTGEHAVITDNFGRTAELFYTLVPITNQTTKRVINTFIDPAGNQYLYEHDSKGFITKVTFPDKTANDLTDNPFKEYLYDDRGYTNVLTNVKDELGNIYATYDYDSFNRATSTEHAGGALKATIGYTEQLPNQLGLSSVKLYRNAANYSESDYQFEIKNGTYKVVSHQQQPCVDCAVGTYQYQYDDNGMLSQATQPDGTITAYQYNSKGQQLTRTEAFGTAEARTISTAWHSSYNLPLSVDEPQRLTTYSYDANGNLLLRSVKDKATNETRTVSYTYNSVGQVLTVNGARTDVSDITTYEYDASGNGNLVKVTNALGHETLITSHDAHGKPLSVTDPNGTVTSMAYHPRGWLTSMTTAGDTTTYAYDKAGQLTSVTMANGVVLNYEYDAAQRLTAIVDGQGNRIEYTLDYMSNRTRTEIKDSSGTIKSFATSVFNDLGRLKETLGANNQSNKVDYDAEGLPTQSTDALNNPTANYYDTLDRLIKVVDPALGETEFDYDSQNRLTSVTDATNKTTSYAYNAFGEVTSQTSPDSGTSSFTYDSAGNLSTVTDARNITATYSYDALNRVTSISYPNASENVSFVYDATANNNKGIGRLTSINDESGSTSYQYDAKGQLSQETRVINGVSFVTAYGYDAAGLLTQVAYPSGRIVDYNRNNLGQVISVATSADGQTQTLASNISYLPFGPLQSLTFGNGKVLSMSYDQDYRLINKSFSGINDLSYGYTPRNNINSIVDSFDSNFDQSFNYDNLARLTDATGAYGDQDYSFDAIGNRLTKTQDGSTENYQYDAASHRLTQAGATNLSYDAMGNTLTKGDLSFTYNQMGRMVTANKTGMSALYQYNAQGERVKKTVDGDITLYHYDQAGQLIAETSSDGTITQEYIYLNGMRLATLAEVGGGADQNNKTVYFDGDNGALEGWTIFDNNPAGAAMVNEFDTELNSNVIVLTGDGTKNGFRLKNASNKNWNNKTQFYLGWKQKTSAMLLQVKIASNEGNKTIVYYSKAGTNSVSSNGNTFKIYLGNEAKNNSWQTFTRDLQADLALLNSTIQLTNVKFIQVKGHGRLDDIALLGEKPKTQEILYVHTDHLGSPIALTDESGSTQWQGSYDPYGNLTVQLDNVSQKLRFPGQISDAETGMHYNYFRDYDPEIGRYLQSDPIGLNGGINTYGYVGANPVNFVDPLGLHSTDAHNLIIDVFGRGDNFTSNQISHMQAGSKFADSFWLGNQEPYTSYIHAMTSSTFPDKYKACLETKKYIEGKLKNYEKFLKQGNEFRAYHSLGQALHPVMDNTSPAHVGFQPWNNSQIPRHGDFPSISIVFPSPMGGSVGQLTTGSEEDLQDLLKNPELLQQTVNDMNNVLKGGTFDCQCDIE
ncbi:RHS repeat-associated core domain-containing protein [Kangiella sp. TOML190]|uniref:RHS repeat-associated core domain-containing protein n=1 Tax=Kangiella sp. TOML190 TaxID=2931351 RepID=UPI00203BB466|nr:RHS repeat-associated core domain-containing protein [Kangiella sp. TOML190]